VIHAQPVVRFDISLGWASELENMNKASDLRGTAGYMGNQIDALER
jgi:hypothetical protein